LKKIAIFVEGQTERVFMVRFLSEYLGVHKIEMRLEKNLGDRGVKYLGMRKNPYAEYYILVYDVGGDGNVVSAVNFVKERLNIDLIRDDPESYNHPTEILKDIFNLFDEKYKKKEKQAHKIAANLDYSFLICSDVILNKISSFHYFVRCLDESLE
jgi:hypothetical protein